MPEPRPDRCHACDQPLIGGVVEGRAVWGCANCNVFAYEDGTGGYFTLDTSHLRALAARRPPDPSEPV